MKIMYHIVTGLPVDRTLHKPGRKLYNDGFHMQLISCRHQESEHAKIYGSNSNCFDPRSMGSLCLRMSPRQSPLMSLNMATSWIVTNASDKAEHLRHSRESVNSVAATWPRAIQFHMTGSSRVPKLRSINLNEFLNSLDTTV